MLRENAHTPPVSDVDTAAAGLTLDELFVLADQVPGVPFVEHSKVDVSIAGEIGPVIVQADADTPGLVEDLSHLFTNLSPYLSRLDLSTSDTDFMLVYHEFDPWGVLSEDAAHVLSWQSTGT